MGFGKTSTTTQSGSSAGKTSTSLAPQVQSAYDKLLGQFGGLSDTTAANSNVTGAGTGLGALASSAANNPYYAAAGNTLATAANPASTSIQDYLSPYLNQALQTQIASQNQQNAQQQQQVVGDAIAKGAYGGNRVGVAQGELAGQQAIANNQANSALINSAYQQAENAALQGQANLGSIGAQQANLGSSQIGSNLSSLLGQLQAGEYQQTAPYTNLGSLASAANALSNYGQTATSASTTSGQTTQPAGNWLSSLLGTGLSIASLFKDGGHVHGYADGGLVASDALMQSLNDAARAEQDAAAAANDNQANDNFSSSGGNLGGMGSSAQQQKGFNNLRSWLHFADGGVAREAFADGGVPYGDFFAGSGLWDYSGLGATPSVDETGNLVSAPDNAQTTDPITTGSIGAVPTKGLHPLKAPAPPPEPVPQAAPAADLGGASSFLPSAAPGIGNYSVNGPPTGYGIPDSNAGYATNLGDVIKSVQAGKGLNLSPDARMALLSAGLGIMGGTSPNAFTNIGQGAQKGLDQWMKKQELNRENSLAQSQIGLQQGELGLEGQKVNLSSRQLWLDAQRAAAEISNNLANANRTNVLGNAERWETQFAPQGMVIRSTQDPTNVRIIPYGQLAKFGSQLPGGSANPLPAPEQGQASPPAAGGNPAASTAAPDGKPPSAPPADNSDASQGFVTQAPDNPPINGMLFSTMGQQIAANQATGKLTEADKNYQAAQQMQVQLDLMKDAAKNLPETGLLSQGAGATTRGQIVKNINALLNVAGVQPIDPTAIGSMEELNKQTTRLGFDLSRTLGSNEAGYIVSQATGAVPGIENTKQGFARIVSGLEAVMKRQKDYYQFLQDWASKTGGDVTGADSYFNQVNPPQKYVNWAIAQTAVKPRSQADIDNAPPGTVFDINGKLMVK